MNKRKLSFKWFGSLTNLSARRPPDETNHKTASKHDGTRGADPAGDQSVDDMESCLRSPGYARSSDMYTHVGTVPRSDRRKSCKDSKKKKKKKEGGGGQAEAGGGQSQQRAGEQVRDSPLLSALSGLSLTALDRPLPAVPMPTRPPPPSHSPASDRGSSEPRTPSGESLSCEDAVEKPSNMAAAAAPGPPSLVNRPNAVSAGPAQDLYVPMDPIAEATRGHVEQRTGKRRGVIRTQETANPPEGSQEVETLDSPPDSTDSSGEYVKFSKEKFWLQPPSEELRKELEEELKLSGSNLRSHAWYHGCTPWEVSESLVLNHGDFLIRDSQSNQGDYVLTSHWDRRTLHFLISKSLVQSGEAYSRTRYTLEGEAFDSVPALVHFYVGNRAALTRQSGAQIHRPVNRTLPLSYLETAFRLAGPPGPAAASPSCHRGQKTSSGGGAEVCPCR
uniref:SH2 domain-containing protein 3C-like n=1 Tax=Centroberyx gerrardi TaxID=166262 RepID=UPI003AACAA48